MSRIAVATAFAGAIVFASDDADARAVSACPRPRPSRPLPRPMAKPVAAGTAKPGVATSRPKPFAAAKPANPQPVGGGSFVVIGGPRPAAANPQGAPAARGGRRRLGSASVRSDARGHGRQGRARPDRRRCRARNRVPDDAADRGRQRTACREASRSRPTTPRKIETAPPSANPALVPVRPKRQAPVVATVCYVQRDGSCVPSF